MVKRFLTSLTREIRGLHEAAYLLALFTLLSQLLALIRDRALASFFGASPALDAYFAAFRMPDTVFAILTLFVSAYALVPMLNERGGASTDRSRALLGSVLVAFGVVAIAVSVALFFAAPVLERMLFPGFSPELLATTIALSQIMLLQPILLGLSSIAAAVVQASRQFFLYALAPIFYNAGIIAGIFFLYPTLGLMGLAWGVVLGAALHLVVQAAPLFMNGYRPPTVSLAGFRDAWIAVMTSFPRAAALSANQLLLLAFAGAASLAAAGSVAAMSFAYNLQSVPLSVIGVSYASALFPSLALLFAKGDRETFMRETWAAVRHALFWLIPIAALVIVLRAQIVRVVLGSGAFSWEDTRTTAAILAAFALSLAAQAVILIFSRAYYASRLSLVPITVNVLAALVAAGAAAGSVVWFSGAGEVRWFVESLFRIQDIPGSAVVMIGLVYSGVYLVAAAVLGVFAARRFGYERRTTRTLATSAAAAVIGGGAAYVMLQIVAPYLPTETFIGIFAEGLAGGITGLLAWAATLYLLKSEELVEIISVLKRRGSIRS